MRRAAALLTSLLLLSGCLTHVPRVGVRPPLGAAAVAWRPDLAHALDEARREDRPLLIVAVAGDRDGFC